MEKTLKIESLKTTQLVGFYNQLTGKDIKKFTDRATAEARVKLVLKEHGKIIIGTPDEPTLADKEATPVSAAPYKSVHGDDWKIKLVAATNPKREGSDAAARFALYKDGMTVAEFLEACAALGQQLNGKPMPRFRFRADIKWDEAKGFITLEK
jgi:hypothetical protein